MLEIDINLNPFGHGNIKNIGKMVICNAEKLDNGLYNCYFFYREKAPIEGPPLFYGGIVRIYDREQPVYSLIRTCLLERDTWDLRGLLVYNEEQIQNTPISAPEDFYRCARYLVLNGNIT